MLSRMQFSGVWRDYQQRVLDEFDRYRADARLHIVAAPGSGKTVLGLELMRRFGRPAIVLSPTRTIRDQWPARLVPHYLPEPPPPVEVSFDLAAPAALTSVTYQALHALWAADGLPPLLEALRAVPISLILDEAHHLRREWWNALQALVEALPDVQVIALTATPPYDAPYSEWARYDAMCGPIDLEIGIPELVRNGDLCPHQDHIHFSLPDVDAMALLERRRRGIASIGEVLRDERFLTFLLEHPWLRAPVLHAEEILEAPEMLSAMLVHLEASGIRTPRAPRALLGITHRQVPAPSPFWFEVLLNGLLFRYPQLFPIEAHYKRALSAVLHEYGLIEGGRVRLGESRSLFQAMAGSLAKLDSIVEIARAEAASLGARLRLVVLTDHVRAGELSRIADPGYRPPKLGVVPVFEALRRAGIAGQSLGVLTGSLVLVPCTAEAQLRAIAETMRFPAPDCTSVAGCPDHLRADGPHIVELVTALFAAGGITMLVGTQALLGEGWDAPAVNSLVLASNSAAFMLSNQMRGRAIRVDPGQPDKVANIWHLATVEGPFNGHGLRARFDWGALDEGDEVRSDLTLLARRFAAFEGISNGGAVQIESGVARLGFADGGTIAELNARTLAIARERSAIAEVWRGSLGSASPRAHVRETVSPGYTPRGLAWRDTLRGLIVAAASSGLFAAAQELANVDGWESFGTVTMGLAGAAGLAALPGTAKAAWLGFRNGSLEASLERVSAAILASFAHAGIVSAVELEGARLEVRRRLSGRCDIVLHGTSRATERKVMEAIAELLGPVRNPRYLLVRRSWLGLRQRADYHAVPSAIGQRKEWAEHFHHEWRKRVGSSRLVLTRTPKGRLILLRARARSFAAGFQRRVDRQSAWM